MDTRRILELVKEYADNPFGLVTVVVTEQKEADALIAEQSGATDIATAIRSN